MIRTVLAWIVVAVCIQTAVSLEAKPGNESTANFVTNVTETTGSPLVIWKFYGQDLDDPGWVQIVLCCDANIAPVSYYNASLSTFVRCPGCEADAPDDAHYCIKTNFNSDADGMQSLRVSAKVKVKIGTDELYVEDISRLNGGFNPNPEPRKNGTDPLGPMGDSSDLIMPLVFISVFFVVAFLFASFVAAVFLVLLIISCKKQRKLQDAAAHGNPNSPATRLPVESGRQLMAVVSEESGISGGRDFNRDGDSPSPGQQSSDDSPTSGQQSSGDSPTSGQQSSGDSPTSGQQSSGDSPTSGQQSSGDSPTSGQQSSDDSPTSGQQSSGDSPTSSHQSSGDSPTSGQQSSGDCPTPGQQSSGDCPTVAPGQQSSGDSPTPGQQSSGDSPTPGQQSSGDCGQQSSGDSPTPGQQSSGDSPTPGQQSSGDSPTPGQQSSGDSPASGQQSSDNSPASGLQPSGSGQPSDVTDLPPLQISQFSEESSLQEAAACQLLRNTNQGNGGCVQDHTMSLPSQLPARR